MFFAAPSRTWRTRLDATGIIGHGGLETAEIEFITAENDLNIPEIHLGENFELSYSGVPGHMIAAHGCVLRQSN